MQWENLYYALAQLVHNFGAVAVLGGALVAFKLSSGYQALRKNIATMVLVAWVAQLVSGLTFGGISLYYYGETPDLHSTAQYALGIKVFCAISSVLLSSYYLMRAEQLGDAAQRRAWMMLTVFAATALTAAAFLRWFS